jgi:hypothetical protein
MRTSRNLLALVAAAMVLTSTATNAQSNGTATACLPTTQPPQHSLNITRNSLFWFTQAYTNDPSCVTLKQAIIANGGTLSIGFLCLPTTYWDNNNVLDAQDTLIEALGFYYRGKSSTGEARGTQNEHLPASRLCRIRKKLAVELIAAIANNVLLGTAPENATYISLGVTNSFPADLIEQAGQVAAGQDANAAQTMTALLKKFNQNPIGVTNNFPNGLLLCSENKRRALRTLSRDATTQLTCPGINQSCETAHAIVSLPFTSTVDLSRYTDTIASPSCGVGGVNAVYQISPPVGAVGRHFTIDTFGSNFDTLLSVFRASTAPLCSNLVEVTCSDNTTNSLQSQAMFTTDGTSTYFVVGEGKNGAIGNLKLKVTSP